MCYDDNLNIFTITLDVLVEEIAIELLVVVAG